MYFVWQFEQEIPLCRAWPGSGMLTCLKEFRAKISTEDMKTNG